MILFSKINTKKITFVSLVFCLSVSAFAQNQQRPVTLTQEQVMNVANILLSNQADPPQKEHLMLGLSTLYPEENLNILDFFIQAMKVVCKGIPAKNKRIESLKTSVDASFFEWAHIRHKLNQLDDEMPQSLKNQLLEKRIYSLIMILLPKERDAFKKYYNEFKQNTDDFIIPSSFPQSTQVIQKLYEDNAIRNDQNEVFTRSFKQLKTEEELLTWLDPLARLYAVNQFERFFLANDLIVEISDCLSQRQVKTAENGIIPTGLNSRAQAGEGK